MALCARIIICKNQQTTCFLSEQKGKQNRASHPCSLGVQSDKLRNRDEHCARSKFLAGVPRTRVDSSDLRESARLFQPADGCFQQHSLIYGKLPNYKRRNTKRLTGNWSGTENKSSIPAGASCIFRFADTVFQNRNSKPRAKSAEATLVLVKSRSSSATAGVKSRSYAPAVPSYSSSRTDWKRSTKRITTSRKTP